MLIPNKNSSKVDFKNFAQSLTDDDKVHHEIVNPERMDAYIKKLSDNLGLTTKSTKGKDLLEEVLAASDELLSSYLLITKELSKKALTPASEWFLDNFHIIEDQLRSIKRDLPEDYYLELPKVRSGEFAGYPRVYAIAQSIVTHNDARIDIESIKRFINSFQKQSPLTIGELWAVAITLRISLIKQLLPIVRRVIFSRSQRESADQLADELLELIVKSGITEDDVVEALSTSLSSETKKFNRPFIVQLIQRLRDQDPGIFKSTEWLEKTLNTCGQSTGQLIQLEHFRQAADQVSVGNIITSMRLFSIIDWHDFFESVSLVDPILARDPDGSYPKMDIATRDSYRKVIERISKRTGTDEISVATKVLESAETANKHIGFFLFESGVHEIERSFKYRLSLKERFVRFVDRRPGLVYFGSILILTLGIMSLFINYFDHYELRTWQSLGMILLLIVPVSDFCIGLINYITTLLKKPKRLPRMDYRDGVPTPARTMVVVPCLFNNEETIQNLVNNLEVQYLANQDENIFFSLLGDLKDADTEVTEVDKGLLNLVHQLIDELNSRYTPGGSIPKFYAFHRVRKYNPSEAKWLGWERKRGKIHEFNQLLRGATDTSYLPHQMEEDFLLSIKYIITLDADTQLPLQNARRLIGTITHPLNRAVYSEKEKRIVKGYGIIQPRISVSLVSAAKTRFSQIFSGNTGIDPYTTAVSDVYQDLFGEGTYTGKGLYDLDAFEKVLHQKVPENAVLSHDLFEGSFTRVGLVTDFELIDDYPSDFETFSKRSHRWTRGDWQLLPWLFPRVKNARGESLPNNLPLVARWKIFDNLRRSLLAPLTLLWLVLAWTCLPGSSLEWTVGIILTMSFSVYASSIQDFIRKRQIPWSEHLRGCVRTTRIRIEQVFLMLVYMPEVANSQIDAIVRALYRMYVSRKHLLEWVSFSQVQGQKKREGFHWTEFLTPGPLFSVGLGTIIFFTRPSSFLVAFPFLVTWLITPYISYGTRRPVLPHIAPLKDDEKKLFRRYARMTWHFFETFAGASENWLAPDNFQEDPLPVIAHRTSPTNIGLQLLANLSAFDLGYIGLKEFVHRTESTFETLNKLPTFEGHFFNWYDTLTLQPLHPQYVSTVDSGNLAGHLITLKQACLEMAKGNYTQPDFKQGLLDSLMVLEEYVRSLHGIANLPRSGSLKRLLNTLHRITEELPASTWDELQNQMHVSRKLLNDLVFDEKPAIYQKIINLMDAINHQISSYKNEEVPEQNRMRLKLKTIAYQSHDLAHSMNFKFLFDEQRKIFAIGYNVTDSRLDDSFYDLLASESRLASFFSISKGDAPDEHWFRLGRQLTHTVGSRALVSWSATMFEYLMPLLVMKRYEETLLDQTYESVVRRQIEYGLQRQIPWGVSEAGYNARDINYNYQYGPFGIPGLGLKRGLRDELVVSPYSTMLAAMVLPQEALLNLAALEKIEALGQYGFYESIDYTPERVPKNKKSVILHSYMAHHQGMSLLSINNLINANVMQERFHLDPRNQAIQLLLQERIPTVSEIAQPRAEETHVESFSRLSENLHARIYDNPTLATPRTQILSNGAYSVMMTSAGSGFSKCYDRMISRWKEDPTLDDKGQFIYIKNTTSGKAWSAGYQPLATKPKRYEASFSEDKVEITREDNEVRTHTEVIISSEDNVELRRVTIINDSSEAIELEVTSFMEVTLARANDDAAHPSFSNLFIQTEFYPGINALLATRRPRAKTEKEYWGMHVVSVEGDAYESMEFETDRSRFIGRGRSVRNPAALLEGAKLSGTVGAVLDPIFSLKQKIKIPARKHVRLVFSTGFAHSRQEVLHLAEKYRDPNIFSREVNLGWVKSQITLRHLNITLEKAHIYQRLGGRILYLSPYLRSPSNVLAMNQRQQSALWAYGISGDIPIILTRIHDDKDMPMVRELLRAHEYLKLKGLKVDLVILNEHATSYLQTLQEEVMRQILISGAHHLLDQPGGIFVRKADMISEQDLTLLKSVARVNILAEKGSLEEQLKRRPIEKELPANFVATLQHKKIEPVALKVPELSLFNGFGGFSKDNNEYIIHLKENQTTPAPWINVIANKNDFGFIVSESGQGYTWSVNSRENRLTSWSNDPIVDPTSEAIYLRDEETGVFWSATPLPIRSKNEYLIRHGQGYSEFEHSSHGISHRLTLFVPLDETVKIQRLIIKNETSRPRKLTVNSYVEWVLGFAHAQTASTVVTEWDKDQQAVLARNTYNNEFAERVAFMASSEEVQSFTCDRSEFLGRNGSTHRPEGLSRESLGGREGGGFDPCAVLQSVIELKPNEEREIIILLGQSHSTAEALSLVKKFKSHKYVNQELKDVKEYWDTTLGALEIKTPDESMNLLVNRWLLYQTLSCRYWARSAFYQSGGAFGFRDQLQDVMAMVYSHPEITRKQILIAASRQFPEGDVQHWWHPPTGRGVRTRFSDDLLWLPYVLGFYVKVTGDYSILMETVSFIETPTLSEGHDETYTQPWKSEQSDTIFGHCLRAIDRSLKTGPHGLPLFGSGDWNDGMNRVGNLGTGESVWMGWFLSATLKAFIPCCEHLKDSGHAETYQKHLEFLKTNIENNAWDGNWYLRAYFDNGEKMGSHENEECQIDAIAQSWAILSGQGDPERVHKALESVNQHLVKREEGIIKLFTPPFDKSSQDPGYIKGYVPGVRENGGQYTHAAIWTMMAYAAINEGDTAMELFSMINPINHAKTQEDALKYKVEPYVIAADIYGLSPHVGRGGWSWYTGSSSWMYRAAIESILGFKLENGTIKLNPCLPKAWNGFEMVYRKNKTAFNIQVLNHQGTESVEVDGVVNAQGLIPVIDDGATHKVIVRIK